MNRYVNLLRRETIVLTFLVGLFCFLFFHTMLLGVLEFLHPAGNFAVSYASGVWILGAGCFLISTLLFRLTIHRSFVGFELLPFGVFGLCYIARIFYEIYIDREGHYKSPGQFLGHFIVLVVIPFLGSYLFKPNDRTKRLIITVAAGLSFIYCCFFIGVHWEPIFSGSRFTSLPTRKIDLISSHRISYEGALVFFIAMAFSIANSVSLFRSVFVLVLLVGSFILLGIGGSRGAYMAIFVGCVVFTIFGSRVLRGRALVSMLLFVVWIVSDVNGVFGEASAGVTRVVSPIPAESIIFADTDLDGVSDVGVDVGVDVGARRSSEIRWLAWRDGAKQFLENPWVGSNLHLEPDRYHPHSMFIEVGISTGILGFIPFVVAMGVGVWITCSTLRCANDSPYELLCVSLFILGGVNSSLSGSISTASTLAIGYGLVLSLFRNRYTASERGSR